MPNYVNDYVNLRKYQIEQENADRNQTAQNLNELGGVAGNLTSMLMARDENQKATMRDDMQKRNDAIMGMMKQYQFLDPKTNEPLDGNTAMNIVKEYTQTGNISTKFNLSRHSTGMTPEQAGARAAAVAKATAPYKNGSNINLSPEDADTWGSAVAQTGQLPAGLGMGGQALKAQLLHVGAQKMRDQGVNPAAQSAQFKANQTALAQLEKQRASVLSFAETADRNLDIVNQLSSKVGRTGMPVLNRWLVAGKRSLAGDPDVASFDAALRTAINEYAKVTSSATGGGVTSDSARAEIEGLLNSAQTPEQIQSVIGTLKREMNNRKAGYESQLQRLREGIGVNTIGAGIPVTPQVVPQVPPQAQPVKQGGVLHQDKFGRKAMVYPDGTYQVVQ